MSCACQAVIDGVPAGGGGFDALWEFDWTRQPSQDFQPLGAGPNTITFGGEQITFQHQNFSTVYRNVNGVGLEVQAAVSNRGWTGPTPSAPHHRFHMEGILPDWSTYTVSRENWCFWWQLSAWDLPESSNSIGVGCDKTSGDSSYVRGGIRRGPYAGPPASEYGAFVAGEFSTLDTTYPGAEDWTVLAVLIWGRVREASVLGGPASAWGNTAAMYEIGSASRAGSTSVMGVNANFVMPFPASRFLFGVPTYSTSGQPSATLTRQMITRVTVH